MKRIAAFALTLTPQQWPRSWKSRQACAPQPNKAIFPAARPGHDGLACAAIRLDNSTTASEPSAGSTSTIPPPAIASTRLSLRHYMRYRTERV